VVVRSPRSAALPARYCRRSLVRARGRESGRRNRDRTTSGRVIRPQPTHEVSTRSLSACAERLALTRETVKSAFATRSGQELTTFLPRPTNSGRPQRRSDNARDLAESVMRLDLSDLSQEATPTQGTTSCCAIAATGRFMYAARRPSVLTVLLSELEVETVAGL
jgi:hypothetical protein